MDKHLILSELRLIISDYQAGNLSDSALSSKLNDIQASLRLHERVYGKQDICPNCEMLMSKHHIC